MTIPTPAHRIRNTAIPLVCALLLSAACDAPREPPAGGPAAPGDSVGVMAGRVGESPILMSEIEAPIQLQLYDHALQRYHLLRQSLEIVALERLDASEGALRHAELRLEPPTPPRLPVTPDSERIRPRGSAPVTLVAFCNFESSHCRRLQLLLARILPLYGDTVQIANRDLAMPFHRNAGLAAEAARCALEQDRYWRFHDLLFAGSGSPDGERIGRVARAAQLDIPTFDTCLESGRHTTSVAADGDAATALGIDAVPALFVNGLYAGSNPLAGQLVWLIEQELERLGQASPRTAQAQRASAEPLIIKALLHSAQPGQGLVMLAPASSPEQVGSFRVGDEVGTHVTVRRITRDRVEFLNQGISEWLDLAGEPAATPAAAVTSPPEQTTDEEGDPARLWPHRAVPVTLDRNEVLIRLADRPALERALVPVSMTAGGFHLLRIAEIEPGSLYELLGLEQRDVILMVNEQPLHEGENPLWHALQSEEEVRLRVMRSGGLARHFTYRFTD